MFLEEILQIRAADFLLTFHQETKLTGKSPFSFRADSMPKICAKIWPLLWVDPRAKILFPLMTGSNGGVSQSSTDREAGRRSAHKSKPFSCPVDVHCEPARLDAPPSQTFAPGAQPSQPSR